MEAYALINKNKDILKSSSSGGVFYELAKYVLDNKGIVFGAAWNNEWLVDMIYIDNIDDIKKLQGSKYIKADNKNTFKECKDFLDNNKLVLYSGTPCQITALKFFLKKEYNNLLTISIACHGTMPKQIWLDYLETWQRPAASIIKINMRSKENTTWDKYNFVIEYSDGKKLIEEHNKNKYMKAFLSDKYLNDSCYNCQCKDNIQSDIILGDYWGVSNLHKDLGTSNGVSFICINTNNGKNAFNNIKDNLQVINTSYDNIYKNNAGLHSKINKNKEVYTKDIFKKKVGIITCHLHENIGGILQAFALQKVIKKLNYQCQTFTWKDNRLPNFAKKNIDLVILDCADKINAVKESDFDIFIVGSDQIWRKKYMQYGPSNLYNYILLGFSNNWNKVRFSYAASLGTGGKNWEYNAEENKIFTDTLNQYNGVSVRELVSIEDFKNKLNIDTQIHIDPTLLLNQKDYLDLCNDIECKQLDIFAYILDLNSAKKSSIEQFSKNNNLKNIVINSSNIQEWLANFRDAKYIITDSFHGCIFSIIFNKPFVYIKNNARGEARFDTLKAIFSLSNELFNFNQLTDLTVFKYANITKLKELKVNAYNYLKDNLSSPPKNFIFKGKSITPKKNQNNKKSEVKQRTTYLYF